MDHGGIDLGLSAYAEPCISYRELRKVVEVVEDQVMLSINHSVSLQCFQPLIVAFLLYAQALTRVLIVTMLPLWGSCTFELVFLSYPVVLHYLSESALPEFLPTSTSTITFSVSS